MTKVQVMASSPFEGQFKHAVSTKCGTPLHDDGGRSIWFVVGTLMVLWGGREGMTLAVVLFDEVCYRACTGAMQVSCTASGMHKCHVVSY